MIVANLTDTRLQATLLRAARPDEDVVLSEEALHEALTRGYPRLRVVQRGLVPAVASPTSASRPDVPVLVLSPEDVEQWESQRGRHEVPPARAEFHARLLRGRLEAEARTVLWVDRIFRKLEGAVGGGLPSALRSFGRRVLEHPSHYTTLAPHVRVSGVSDQALKGRFRRRDLASPSVYLRWFRAMAVAEALGGMGLDYRRAAYRLGFASSANMCRFVESTTELSTAHLTIAGGRDRLLTRFVARHLQADDLVGWERLEGVFERGVA